MCQGRKYKIAAPKRKGLNKYLPKLEGIILLPTPDYSETLLSARNPFPRLYGYYGILTVRKIFCRISRKRWLLIKNRRRPDRAWGEGSRLRIPSREALSFASDGRLGSKSWSFRL